MKYLWIVMLAIPYSIWAVLSVFDFVFSIIYKREPYHFTVWFVAVHTAALFGYSLLLWCSG